MPESFSYSAPQVYPQPKSAIEPEASSIKSGINTEKIIGYLLLTVGLVFIFASLWQVYQVFTGQKKPPQVFWVESPSIALPNLSSFSLPEGIDLPEGFKLPKELSSLPVNQTEPQQVKLLPDELFNGSINMGIFFLLMTFVASTGSKIASLGINMLKEIKVSVKKVKFDNA